MVIVKTVRDKQGCSIGIIVALKDGKFSRIGWSRRREALDSWDPEYGMAIALGRLFGPQDRKNLKPTNVPKVLREAYRAIYTQLPKCCQGIGPSYARDQTLKKSLEALSTWAKIGDALTKL